VALFIKGIRVCRQDVAGVLVVFGDLSIHKIDTNEGEAHYNHPFDFGDRMQTITLSGRNSLEIQRLSRLAAALEPSVYPAWRLPVSPAFIPLGDCP